MRNFFFGLILLLLYNLSFAAPQISPTHAKYIEAIRDLKIGISEQMVLEKFGNPDEKIPASNNSFVKERKELKAKFIYRFIHPEFATVSLYVGMKNHKVSGFSMAISKGSIASYEELMSVPDFLKEYRYTNK
jgi:hypothetical protein